jgi:hypothetical protein
MTTKKDQVVIDIDMNKFMIEDLELLDKCARGEKSLSDEIDLFERVVVGGVRGKYKATEIRKIRSTILDALRESANDPS